MKNEITRLIVEAIDQAFQMGQLPSGTIPPVELDVPKVKQHGDFASNIAMIMASIQKMAPRKIAEAIVSHIADPRGILLKTEIAGPGFINFFVKPSAWLPVLEEIHKYNSSYGSSDLGQGQRVQVEFVSANPTGPLHIGHGRGAAVGDSVANILRFSGYAVEKEYYINDSGRQIATLGRSVWLRYREMQGQSIEFPKDCYQGDYINELAKAIGTQYGHDLERKSEEDAIAICARYAAAAILDGIKSDLQKFGVVHDHWFSEQSLYDSNRVSQAIAALRDEAAVYEKDGALWFKTSQFGDEKDRVVVRSNGQTTYFASDIAYHREKYERGFDRVIDVWGADHHGYIPRMAAAIEASGQKPEQFQVILVQLVNLLRAGEPVAMSTRSGEFVTLKDVIDEVGKDAARFIFLTRHYESSLDFDLEIAKQKTNDNPVYYVQYVHARISSIARKACERGIQLPNGASNPVPMLKETEEIELIKKMATYPEVVQNSAKNLEPHRITYFLMSLATAFHAYYNKHRVLTDDPQIAAGRLYLVLAVRKVIRSGLTLLGVSAPESM